MCKPLLATRSIRILAVPMLLAGVGVAVAPVTAAAAARPPTGLAAPGAAAVTGPSWALQSTPNPSGTPASKLLGVSCLSATACTAVGYYNNGVSAEVTLAEHWNGTKWAVQPTPNLSGAVASELLGVSCSSAKACIATGYYENSSEVELTLAERWNGTNWAIQTTPNPSGTQNSYLYGVSCSSTSACTAVGFDESGVLAERWNGTKWAVESIPNPSGAIGLLFGVSCPSATACTAVGYVSSNVSAEVTLAEHWNGAKWAVQSTPNPSHPQNIELTGVSCPSATACTAVGTYINSSNLEVTLAEGWNGTKWMIQTTPNPSIEISYLNGVSCPSATDCTATGAYLNNSGVDVTLAEGWNGTKWAVQTTPNPSGALDSELEGVSCPSATACTAAGYYDNSSGFYVTLAEHYS